ncbi:PIN domain-containing protein [Streptomyces sp. NPDC005070]
MEISSTFVNGFEGLWRRPLNDYKSAIQTYTIVIDTNVLLDLYRFTPVARQELLDVLKKVRERLWVPHQVSKEYFSRRVDALKDQLDLFDSVPRELKVLHDKAISQVNTFARRCSLSGEDKNALIAPLQQALASVVDEINRHRASLDLTLEKVASEDPILESLAAILDERTGGPFTSDEEKTLLQTYSERAAAKIPPGYRDSGKSENAHGDYFIWEQMIRNCIETKKPTLFITSDVKDDWFHKAAGITVGARPELISEMRDRADSDFLMLQLSNFLRAAKESLGAQVSEATYEAAKNVALESARKNSEAYYFTIEDRLYEEILGYLTAHVDHAMQELQVAESETVGKPHTIDHAIKTRLIQQRTQTVAQYAADLDAFRGCRTFHSLGGIVEVATTSKTTAAMIEHLMGVVNFGSTTDVEIMESSTEKGGTIWARRLEAALAPYTDNLAVRSISPDSVSYRVDDISTVDTEAVRRVAKSFDVDIHLLTANGLTYTARARR